MPDIILHHYPGSPFAEKVRAMLGYKGLAWRSVTIPRILPKPDLMPLTGGYRRTPVMQIGADVFCDTACIARELERRSPAPALFPAGGAGLHAMIGAWADQRLFFGVVGVVFGSAAPETVPAEFRQDRLKFSDGQIDLDRYAKDQPQLRAQLRAHLFWVEHALDDGRRFLTGETPAYADFCVYAPLWQLCNRAPELRFLDDMPLITGWMARIAALGHGQPTDLDAKEALAIAKAAAPSDVVLQHPESPDGLVPGTRITVAADDYGKDPVPGYLVALDAQRIVIRRGDPAVGEVNVHFPRSGYRIARA